MERTYAAAVALLFSKNDTRCLSSLLLCYSRCTYMDCAKDAACASANCCSSCLRSNYTRARRSLFLSRSASASRVVRSSSSSYSLPLSSLRSSFIFFYLCQLSTNVLLPVECILSSIPKRREEAECMLFYKNAIRFLQSYSSCAMAPFDKFNLL